MIEETSPDVPVAVNVMRGGMMTWRPPLTALVAIAAVSVAGWRSVDADAADWPPRSGGFVRSTADSVELEDPGWPREYEARDGHTVTIYQPQIEDWTDYAVLEGWSAVVITHPDSSSSIPGAVRFAALTETNLDTRSVRTFDLTIEEVRFPSLDSAQIERVRAFLDGVVARERILSLDRLLASVQRGQLMEEAKREPVNVEPPPILYSPVPAVLINLDGEPLFQLIQGTELAFAVNTNWNLFIGIADSTYYLLHDDDWLAADSLGDAWRSADPLPADFGRLPADSNWIKVREHLPSRPVPESEIPTVYVSTRPAELILTEGVADLRPIPGTDLLYVANTESDVLMSMGDGQYYYLVSGRWFRAPGLDGPWAAATDDLPEDFAQIPPDHELAHVRASVPGTEEADLAVIESQIPTTAVVHIDRMEARTVTFIGDPEFRSIEGTELAYAVNTESDVVRFGTAYYLCEDGVWFVSDTPTGPYRVATSIPDEIYSIPPSSPVHHVTYVYVYDTDEEAETVTCGYTAGYMGMYVAWSLVLWGTGWWYPPYYWYRRPWYPVYWAYPYSYGWAAWYNPYTGRYGAGGRYYGPYGGIGWGARYNPRTGTYARGAAAWGPYGATGWGAAYNPRTNTGLYTRQSGNAYARWGQSVVTRGDDWIRGGHYTTRRGSVRGFETSEGTQGVRFNPRGEGSGTVVRSDDDLYVGRDGNVYRRDEGGWSKWEGDGSWSPAEGSADRQAQVQDRTRDANRAAGGDRAQPIDRSAVQDRSRTRTTDAAARPSTGSDWSSVSRDLNRSRQARSYGNQRTQQSRNYRSTGGARMRGGRRR